MTRKTLVRRVREAIREADPSATVVLYGSEARGDARPDSDVDLLILLEGDHLSSDMHDQVTSPIYDIELETGVSISPMVVLRKDWENRPFKTPFYVNVMNEGIVI